MKEGPDIALLGALIGDPARANILTALMSGKALTVTELSLEAGVTVQTTSSHLKKLELAGLLRQRKQGRHRYFALADDDVGSVLEAMMGLAAKRGLVRTQTRSRDVTLRKARVCYNHLAGDLGVQLYDAMIANDWLKELGNNVGLTGAGEEFVARLGVNLKALESKLGKSRRPLCKPCLDWSARRTHLAGALGEAILARFYELGWARRLKGSRAIKFTNKGEKALTQLFVP